MKNFNDSAIYEIEGLPVFQNRMYDSEQEAIDCPKGNVRLVEDPHTGLIHNQLFEPKLVNYDQNYQNEQGVSPLFKEHLDQVSLIIEGAIGRQDLIEVGCGKGLFLEILQKKGFEIIGFDPTYEGTNTSIERKYFTCDAGINAKGLILRHVLEHIQNPIDFLFQLKNTNNGSGKIYIEVPCFDWICERKAWFDIFYEHVNYFRLSDFYRLFNNVVSSGHLFGGQYIYIVADLSTLRIPERSGNSNYFRLPQDFTNSLTKYLKIKSEGRVGIWGGASKGVIFSLLMSRYGNPVDFVFDINPAKQGKYLPATGLKVESPQQIFDILPEKSLLYVMNSNYLEEIKEMSHHSYNYLRIDHD